MTKTYFFRWLRGPFSIAEGLVITLTLGVVNPAWLLKAETWYLDAAERQGEDN